MKLVVLCIFSIVAFVAGQRITTIQLDGVQYYVSRMNPYSPELNYFLAYQYCRSIGLQLASFETKEKVDSMTQYLINAGYSNYEFWTSGNHLGTGMYIWMSTGSPFNATFDNFADTDVGSQHLTPVELNSNTSPQRTARDSSSGLEKGCVSLSGNMLEWKTDDCLAVKDFICEQTRCYYYNYGSIPVSSAQGRPIRTTTASPITMKSTPLPMLLSTTYAPKLLNIEKESTVRIASPEKLAKAEDQVGDEEPHLEEEMDEHSSSGDKNDIDSSSDEAMRIDMNDIVPTEASDETDEENTTSVEERIKHISQEIEKISNSQDRDVDVGRQSFISLSDFIKTLRPNDKKIPQIDSDYSNTMRVLGETQSIVSGEARKLKDNQPVKQTR